MTVKKKSEKYHGCPHSWVINFGAPSLKAAALKGALAEAIPKELEPPLTTSDLQAFGTSQRGFLRLRYDCGEDREKRE